MLTDFLERHSVLVVPKMSRTDTFSPSDVPLWKAHFDLHGYCILRNVFNQEALTGAENACKELVENLTQRLLAQHTITSAETHPDAPFNTRLSLVCANCPEQLPNLFRNELHNSKEFYELLCDPTLITAVRQLLASDVDGIRIYPNYSCRPKTKVSQCRVAVFGGGACFLTTAVSLFAKPSHPSTR